LRLSGGGRRFPSTIPLETTTMTIRNWLTMTFAAAMLAGVTGCNLDDGKTRGSEATAPGSGDKGAGSGSSATRKDSDAMGKGSSAGAPEGRRGGNLPRLREMDAGVDSSGTSGRMGSSTGAGSPSGETTSGSSSGSAAGTAPATGTTPGAAGTAGTNGSSTDSANPSK